MGELTEEFNVVLMDCLALAATMTHHQDVGGLAASTCFAQSR
jgi:hypothetical protein